MHLRELLTLGVIFENIEYAAHGLLQSLQFAAIRTSCNAPNLGARIRTQSFACANRADLRSVKIRETSHLFSSMLQHAWKKNTHTHTHIERERERQTDRQTDNPLDVKTPIKNRRPNDGTMHNGSWQGGTTTTTSRRGCAQISSQQTLPQSGRAHGAAMRGGKQPTDRELRNMRCELYKYQKGPTKKQRI